MKDRREKKGGGRKTVAIAGNGEREESRRVALSTDDRGGVSSLRGEEGRWRRVGTLHVLSWHPPSNLHPPPYPGHSTSFSHPSPSPRGKQFSSSSQNPVTPRRAHPETDDKVHPATPAYLRFHPLLPPPSPCVDERVHIYIYIHARVRICTRFVHARGIFM